MEGAKQEDVAVGSVVPGGSAPVVLLNSAVPPYRERMWFNFQKALDGSGLSWQIHLSTIKWTAGTRLLSLKRCFFSSHLKGAGSLRELPVQTTCVLWTWRKLCCTELMSLESCPYIFPEDTVWCLRLMVGSWRWQWWSSPLCLRLWFEALRRNSRGLEAFHLFTCEGRVVYWQIGVWFSGMWTLKQPVVLTTRS